MSKVTKCHCEECHHNKAFECTADGIEKLDQAVIYILALLTAQLVILLKQNQNKEMVP